MTKRSIRFGSIVAPVVLVVLPATMAVAGDEGLYPPPPPAGAGSVRIVDIRAVPRKSVVTVGAKTESTGLTPGPFRYIQQGGMTLTSPNFSAPINVQAGQYYSVLVGNKFSVLYQEPRPPLTQSLVVLYNLSSRQDVSLKTEDGATTVVPSLSAFRVAQRAVNPLKVGFSVYAGSTKVGVVPAVQLKRGASFGIFLLNSSDGVRVVVAPGPALEE